MKIKTAVLVALLMFSWLAAFPQKVKNEAVKFDEFSVFPADREFSLYDRTERFTARLKREPASRKAVIIFYNERKGKYPLQGGGKIASDARSLISDGAEIQTGRIVLLDGGYREFPTLEFWIVPEGAEMPKPTPEYSRSEVVYCPEINVAGSGFRHDPDLPLRFSVALSGAFPEQKLSMEWSVSAGKIVSGQGTNQIEVDLGETEARRITAGLIVRGLPPECGAHAFQTTEVGVYPYLVDQFRHIPNSEISARFDSFMILLGNEPAAQGYILIYGKPTEKKRDVARLTASLRNFIGFRRYDTSRITIVDAGLQEDMMVEFYLVPPGAAPPKPKPTINESIVEPPVKRTKKQKKPRR